MERQVLQITIKKVKAPKTRFGKWFYWKVYFPFWRIWRPKMLSKVFKFLAEITFSMLPKSEQKRILEESNDFDVVVKYDNNDKNAAEDMTNRQQNRGRGFDSLHRHKKFSYEMAFNFTTIFVHFIILSI